MANKPPAFQFYASDWLSSLTVRTMTPEQRGCYIQLLATSWPEGIPVDARGMLWALAGMPDAESWAKIAAPILAQFIEVNGCLVNARLHEQYKQLDSYHRMQKEKAKKGAHARWHASGKDQAMPGDASSSSSSTSTSNNELQGEVELPKSKAFEIDED